MTGPREPLVFELPPSRPGAYSGSAGEPRVPERFAAGFLRSTPPPLPRLSELDVLRHFTRLSQMNMGVDTTFYPLGSCTMKYNPRLNEEIAGYPAAAGAHPLWAPGLVQGCLSVLWSVERALAEVSGFARVSLQPAAGAQGELGAMMMVRAWHLKKGRDPRTIVVPDTSHGTNPASAALCGFRVVTVKSGPDGTTDLGALKEALGPDTAAFMVTNPNTLGLFEPRIAEVARMVHEAGGLVYMDGANMNALLGVVKPAECGVDLMHFNLHKTFSTPHGGGGPGAGAVACTAELAPFLPSPVVERGERDGRAFYRLDHDRPDSIGALTSFHGNFGIILRAWAYIVRAGGDGLARVSCHAVLNSAYVRARLEGLLPAAYPGPSMHETVFTATPLKGRGITALDIAKRLLDYGFHAPTIYFPLVVHEAMMVEPTETESRGTLDAFVAALKAILAEDSELVRTAPHTTPVSRLDDVRAAREPKLRA